MNLKQFLSGEAAKRATAYFEMAGRYDALYRVEKSPQESRRLADEAKRLSRKAINHADRSSRYETLDYLDD